MPPPAMRTVKGFFDMVAMLRMRLYEVRRNEMEVRPDRKTSLSLVFIDCKLEAARWLCNEDSKQARGASKSDVVRVEI